MWPLTILRLIGSRLLAIAGRPVASFVWRAAVAWWWSALKRRRASAARPASRGTPSTPAAGPTEPPYADLLEEVHRDDVTTRDGIVTPAGDYIPATKIFADQKPVDQLSEDGLLLSQQRAFSSAVVREYNRNLPGATAEGDDMGEMSSKFAVPTPGMIRRVENIGHDMPVLGTGEALGLLAGQLDSLEGHIGDLYQRLGPVLAPPGPEGAQPYCQAPTDSDIPGPNRSWLVRGWPIRRPSWATRTACAP